MIDKEAIRKKLDELNCCVIIPTYNNCQTLEEILEKIIEHAGNVIVVNDGSTDGTGEILKYEVRSRKSDKKDLEVISYKKNRGKGYALRTGFRRAAEKGYRYAITLDSDGQHRIEELALFAEKIEQEPDSLIVGVRNFSEQENFEQKSSFANKFSNFWFDFFTDIKLDDTQSGYRLYPLEKLKVKSSKFKDKKEENALETRTDIAKHKLMRFYTNRYEFEFEVLVRAAWRGIKINTVPIKAYYPPREERISHFRPGKDFTRISLLNIVLFFIAVFYKKPYNFIRNLNRKNIKDFIRHNILLSKESNTTVVFSVMLGIFMGIVPLWGYQLILAIVLAYLLKLNKLIVIVFANISITPMIPVIIYLSLLTGGLILHRSVLSLKGGHGSFILMFKQNLFQYLIGSVCLAVIASIISGLITFLLLKILRKGK